MFIYEGGFSKYSVDLFYFVFVKRCNIDLIKNNYIFGFFN